MTKHIKNIKSFYKTLGSNTKLVIRISLITFFWLIIFAIAANYAVESRIHYELLLEIDGILSAAKSIIFIGLFGALFLHKLENF